MTKETCHMHTKELPFVWNYNLKANQQDRHLMESDWFSTSDHFGQVKKIIETPYLQPVNWTDCLPNIILKTLSL